MDRGEELRIVLLGKTGVGKSSVGNTILGEKLFKENSQKREITFCQRKEKVIKDRRIVVIDTPGIFDADLTEGQLQKEIASCMEQCAPGPHVVIVVLGVDRCIEENQQTVEKLLQYFSGDVVHHMVLLFTHGEDLEENMTIHDFIKQSDVVGKKIGIQALKDLAERCGNRVHVIDNKRWNDNSSDLDVLARLKQLNLPEQYMRNITEQMQVTPADKTPWFKTLSDHGGKVEPEDISNEQSLREYQTNRFQITQLMKNIQTILKDNKGQHYTNKPFMKTEKAITRDVRTRTMDRVNMAESRRTIERAKDPAKTVQRLNPLTHFTEIPATYEKEELRIVLLGKTGVGKSAVGNRILGENVFEAECSPESGTQICKRAERVINGRRIVVIDTPGLFETNRSEDELRYEIISSLVECAPGPHVFILVLQVDSHTKENQKSLEKLLELFSGDAVHHTVLLFTHGDNLEENMTIQDFIDKSDQVVKKSGKKSLKDLAERCGNRVHVIDNKRWDEKRKVSDVLASLQGLNLSEEALREITAKMPPVTPGEPTPWFNVLSDNGGNAEAGGNEDQRQYRNNQFQLTQLMKSVKQILTTSNSGHYSNETLEEIGKAINEEVEKIQQEMGVRREAANMVEIRRRARERVRTKSYCVIV